MTILRCLCFLLTFSSLPLMASERPNIILFVSDDQVKEELACYGGNVLTPNLDRLADEGMRFDNAHVTSTVCTPSRYSLLTGRFAGNSYFNEYLAEYPQDQQGNPGFNVGLEDDNMNVGNVLRQSGYFTGLIGKLHVGPKLKKPDDFQSRGLYFPDPDDDVDDPDVIAGWQHNEKWYRQWVKERGFSFAKHNYWGNVNAPYNRHNPEWTLQAALEFIRENSGRPFYLHYTTTLMHGGPKQWNESMQHPLISGAGKLKSLPDVIPSRKHIRQRVVNAGFDSNTIGFTWMDATVGAMLDQLDQLEIADDTLFVFVSDHGTEGKWTLHDHNGTNVPCIMRWPSVIPKGSVNKNLVQTSDFVPTFFDVSGATVPEEYQTDGISLRQAITDPSKPVHEHLFFELGCARGVRTDRWKYIAIRYDADKFQEIESASLKRLPRALSYIGNDKTLSKQLGKRPHYLESDQLYDLDNDPMEATNLANSQQHAAVLSEMKQRLAIELEKQGRPFGEFVGGGTAVPNSKIEPYLQRLSKLKPVHRGFEVIGEATDPVKPRKTRKAKRKRNKTKP